MLRNLFHPKWSHYLHHWTEDLRNMGSRCKVYSWCNDIRSDLQEYHLTETEISIVFIKYRNLWNVASVDLEFWNGMVFLLSNIKWNDVHLDFQIGLVEWWFRGPYELWWRHWTLENMEHGVWIKSNVMMFLLSDPKRNKFPIEYQQELSKDAGRLYVNWEPMWCCWRYKIYRVSRK
jgi:hypothetical protein